METSPYGMGPTCFVHTHNVLHAAFFRLGVPCTCSQDLVVREGVAKASRLADGLHRAQRWATATGHSAGSQPQGTALGHSHSAQTAAP